MKKRLQGYLIGVLSTILLFSCVAYATNTTTLYDVVANGVKIVVNGKKLNPTDANGKKVEPIIYNGTTYLPVRAVANALGEAVYWDGPNFTVYLGDTDGKLEYPTAYLSELTNIGTRKLEQADNDELIDNYGNAYSNAVQIVSNGYVEYLTNMKYSKFKATIYRPEGATNGTRFIKIKADGKIIYTSPALDKTSYPINIDVNIKGYNDIRIEACATSEGYVSNPVVTLADAGFYQ